MKDRFSDLEVLAKAYAPGRRPYTIAMLAVIATACVSALLAVIVACAYGSLRAVQGGNVAEGSFLACLASALTVLSIKYIGRVPGALKGILR